MVHSSKPKYNHVEKLEICKKWVNIYGFIHGLDALRSDYKLNNRTWFLITILTVYSFFLVYTFYYDWGLYFDNIQTFSVTGLLMTVNRYSINEDYKFSIIFFIAGSG